MTTVVIEGERVELSERMVQLLRRWNTQDAGYTNLNTIRALWQRDLVTQWDLTPRGREALRQIEEAKK